MNATLVRITANSFLHWSFGGRSLDIMDSKVEFTIGVLFGESIVRQEIKRQLVIILHHNVMVSGLFITELFNGISLPFGTVSATIVEYTER
jgi:hypothetical protein